MRPFWNKPAPRDGDSRDEEDSRTTHGSAAHPSSPTGSISTGSRRTPADYDPETLGATVEAGGRSLRIDARHPSDHDNQPSVIHSTESSENDEAVAQRNDDDAGQNGDSSDAAENAPERLLAHATELAASVHRQCVELSRREQRLHQQLAQLDAERRTARLLRAEFDEQCEAREAELARLEAELLDRSVRITNVEADLDRQRADLAADTSAVEDQRSLAQQDRAAAGEELAREQARIREELGAERAAQMEELAERVTAIDAEARRVAREREDADAEIAALRQHADNELRQERVLLESRHKFQQEHLEKVRAELENSQTEFRWEQQAARVWLENELLQSRLLRGQLDRRNDLLAEQARSIDRERDLIVRSRRAQEDSLTRERERLASERSHWEHERDVARADIRRQQDLLGLHAENLETRRQRLDKLRIELEETNRKTLETRLAVDEAFAQLAQTAGTDFARSRVEESRSVLSEYYRGTLDSMVRQRQEIDQLQQRLLHQRDELRAEREALAAWGLERERQGVEREGVLVAAREELDAREREARSLRERWLAERRESEAVIRDLLQQLDLRSGLPDA